MKHANNLKGMVEVMVGPAYAERKAAGYSIHSAYRQPVFLKALVTAVIAAISVFSLTGCVPSAGTFPGTPPTLTISIGGQQSTAVLNGCVWPSNSGSTGLSRIEETWPPVLPAYPLFLMPGDSMIFLFQGFKAKPESVNIQVLNIDIPGAIRELTKPMGSTSLKDFQIDDNGVSWTWALPRLEPMPAEEPERTLRIEVTWSQPKQATAVYFVSVSYAEAGSIQEASDEALAYFNCECHGSQASLLALLPPNIRTEYQDQNSYSFKLVSGPEARVRSFRSLKEGHPPVDTIYSEIDVLYTVESTHEPTGKTVEWAFRDSHFLRRQHNTWRVTWITKNSTPWAFDGGKEPGWEITPEQTPLPGDVGTLAKIGPFTWIRFYDSMFFSDDGRYLAFTAYNFSKKEIWIVSRDGSSLERVLSIPAAENANQWFEGLQIIGWAPSPSSSGSNNYQTESKTGSQSGKQSGEQTSGDSPQYKIRFMYSGYQTTGPHKAGNGYWIGEADCDSREIRDVAFISGSWIFEPQNVVVSANNESVVFRHSPNLWKVDLETGKVDLLASDLPSWDGMFTLRVSPSGSYGAYKDLSRPDGPVIVYDFESGDNLTIPIAEPGEGLCSFLLGWTPEDLLVISIARDSDVVIGEGLSYPAGSVELRYYDIQGNLKFKLTSPSEAPDDRIVQWAWSENNDFMAFTLGPVLEEIACSCYEHSYVQHANSLWVAKIPEGPECAGGPESAGQMQGQPVNLEAKYVGPLAGRVHEIKLFADSIIHPLADASAGLWADSTADPTAGSIASSTADPSADPAASSTADSTASSVTGLAADSTADIAIEVWYFPSPDSYDYGDVIWQAGVRFSISGESGVETAGPEDILRLNPFDLETETIIGKIGSTTYLKRQFEAGNQRLHQVVKRTPAREEAVIWEDEAYVPDVRIMSESLVFQAYETQGEAGSPDKNYLYIIDPGTD